MPVIKDVAHANWSRPHLSRQICGMHNDSPSMTLFSDLMSTWMIIRRANWMSLIDKWFISMIRLSLSNTNYFACKLFGFEKKGKSEGFDSCDRPSNLTLDSNRHFFRPCDREIKWMTSKTIGHFFYTTSSFVHHFKSIGEFKLDLQSRNAQFGSKLVICYPVWPWNLMDDLGKQ